MSTTAEQFSQNSLIKLSDNSYSGELTQTIELTLRDSINQDIEFEYVNWSVYKGDTIIYELFGAGISFSVNVANVIGNGPENAGKYSIIADLISTTGLEEAEKNEGSIEITFTLSSVVESLPNAIFIPFVAQVAAVENDIIKINTSWNDYATKIKYESQYKSPTDTFSAYKLSYKINDYSDLNTYLHLGEDNVAVITNVKSDDKTIQKYPHSGIYKLYEPLPEDIEEKDGIYIVRELLPQLEEIVELFPYEQEDEDVLVLRNQESAQVDSPITNRSTALQTYEDLVSGYVRLKKEIEDKFISGSLKPVKLNIDYTQYENFINFSSAEKRLKNFKYKLQLIEEYTAESASFVEVTNAETDANIFDTKIRIIKTNFDGYENYLYHVSSSYESSSLGEFHDASWPKTGSGTYTDPFVPVSSSHTDFTGWYGSVFGGNGQIHSASLYDKGNNNRLVNLLPTFLKEDTDNIQFFDFVDMVGQHFDELWTYTKGIADLTDRQNDLSKGFSTDLIFNLAESLGWGVNDGKDLLDLSRIGFGQKLSGETYSLYTSGSTGFSKVTDGVGTSIPEGEIAKEITK